jgi:1-acyl-sn-glycerol-3-phosphate acyltransferase
MLAGFGRAQRKQIVTGLSNCKAQPLSIVLYPESANSSSAGC